MSADHPTLPPVRLRADAELARDALAAPLLADAARLARWAGPDTRVDAGGELVDEQLPAAAEALGLPADEEGELRAGDAWRLAVDTGLVEIEDGESAGETGAEDVPGRAAPGENLALLTGGSPRDVLALWLDGFDTVFADAVAPVLDDLDQLLDEDGEIDVDALDWDPEAEAEFLEGVLGNLYLLTVSEGGAGEGPVPLPALAASMVVPDDMGEPTDDVLEQVSDAMMRLDEQFRLLEPIGLVEYQPLDEALMVEEGEESAVSVDDEDVTRYGMVRLTPLGLYGVRARMLEAGVGAPAVGDLADKGADALLDGIAGYPEAAAREETAAWLAGRDALGAAREP
ncbi:hypothetical protein, partial [Streptomyces cinereoruber]|uniref:hypothetical protein n=1 Tax=Streptomyces cinereoruber TaxID=67260 RepID=UPI00363E285B